MLVAGFPAGGFQTNCYVLAPGPGQACVVVDPGQDAVEPLESLLAEHRLTPVAVLLTQGHFDHTPGHTPGSIVFRTATEQGDEVILAGDTLFAGSIGRTDLPGGDHAAMLRSLRDKLLTRDDAAHVLPGHGPTTTIGRERASNPFLQGLQVPAPGRGL